MVRKRFLTALLGLLTALFVVCLQTAFAQHEQGSMSGTQKDTMSQHGMMMSHQMMQQMQQDNRSTEAALKDLRAAQSSDDPKILHSALNKAEKALSQVHEHMTSHMKMMESMRGSGAMQGSGETMRHKGMKDSMESMPMDSTKMNK